MKLLINKFNIIRNEKGEVYYEVIIKTIIIVTLLLTVISFYNLFILYQNNNYLCKRITRAIELEGAVSTQVDSTFDNLKAELNLPDAKYQLSNVKYFNFANKTIQLRENFTVTVESTQYIELFNPVFSPTIKIPIHLKSTMAGMSEVFHKE